VNLSLSLTNNMSLTSSAGAFSPLSLSPSAWYDPSDLGTLWKDTAGTDPVTADGDAVARIDDKSANGYHMSQIDPAKRPLYKTSGGLHWLLFDGTNDALTVLLFPATDGSGHHSSAAAVKLTASAGTQIIFDLDDGGTRVSQAIRTDAGTPQSVAFNTAVSVFVDAAAGISTNDAVLTQVTASAAVEIFKDNVGDGSTAITGTMKTGTCTAGLGAGTSGTSSFLNGRIYGAIHLIRALTAGERASIATYLGGKQGRTI
jgi:hypothetical protein